ncbi:MAG: hypothetical protein EPN86_04460 [Nanoarchaeota archaeon]|nr:MAG: hypothetical protein EPN86_04460 [Nanoarchaeota archaeon]
MRRNVDECGLYAILAGLNPILEVSSGITITSDYCDDYGNHLNNSLALKLFEEERLRIMDSKGLTKERFMADFKKLPMVRSQHPRYYSQIFEGQELELLTSFYVAGARAYAHQRLVGDGAIVLENVALLAFANERGMPSRIPPEVIDILSGN